METLRTLYSVLVLVSLCLAVHGKNSSCASPYHKCSCSKDSSYSSMECTNGTYDMSHVLPTDVSNLTISGGKFVTFPKLKGSFKKLVYLDISGNRIHHLRRDMFDGMHLKTLVLSNNFWKVPSTPLLKPSTPLLKPVHKTLSELYLDYAFTKEEVQIHLLRNFSSFIDNSQLMALKVLSLRHNKIVSWDDHFNAILCSLTGLHTLNLADNLIFMPMLLPTCGAHLQKLVLRDNKIVRLSPNFTAVLDDIANRGGLEVDLRDNPLRCDCTSRDLKQWSVDTNVTLTGLDKGSLKCVTGPLAGRALQNATLEEFTCPSSSSSSSPDASVVILSVIFAILAVLTVAVAYLNRHKFVKCYNSHVKPFFSYNRTRSGYSNMNTASNPSAESV